MEIRVARFEPSLVEDFYTLHSIDNNAGWCFCAAWWVDTWTTWSQRTADQNRRLRERLLAEGEYDGYLIYLEDKPVGWCQVGPRDRLVKLTNQFQLDEDPECWAITCFLIAPGYRRLGLAGDLLGRVLDDLRERGIKRVEAYPRRGDELDDLDLWNGPEAMYREAGFEIVRDDPRRPILGLDLTLSDHGG